MGSAEMARYQGRKLYILFLSSLTFLCSYLVVRDLVGGPREFWIDDVVRIAMFSIVAAFLTSFLLLPTILLQTLTGAPQPLPRLKKTVGASSIGLKFIFTSLMVLPLSIFLSASLLIQVFSGEVYINSFQQIVSLEEELDVARRGLDLGSYYMSLLETLSTRLTERLYMVATGTPQYILLISFGFICAIVMLPAFPRSSSVSLENVLQYRLMRSLTQRAGVIVNEFTIYTPSGQALSVTNFVKLKTYFQKLDEQRLADELKWRQGYLSLKASALPPSQGEMESQIESARRKFNVVLNIDRPSHR